MRKRKVQELYNDMFACIHAIEDQVDTIKQLVPRLMDEILYLRKKVEVRAQEIVRLRNAVRERRRYEAV